VERQTAALCQQRSNDHGPNTAVPAATEIDRRKASLSKGRGKRVEKKKPHSNPILGTTSPGKPYRGSGLEKPTKTRTPGDPEKQKKVPIIRKEHDEMEPAPSSAPRGEQRCMKKGGVFYEIGSKTSTGLGRGTSG